MKFRNKNKFRYGIPAYTGQFRAMHMSVPNKMHMSVPNKSHLKADLGSPI
jgi:hypothetical protein